MAYKNLQRPFPGRELAPIVPHDRFAQDRWSGVWHLQWSIPPEHPVVIGSGAYELHQPTSAAQAAAPPMGRRLTPQQAARLRAAPTPPQAAPKIVAGMVRRGSERAVVLPGSSQKGAVRQIYELFTPSCTLGSSGCKVKPKEAHPKVCPACSLFGTQGLGGRLNFGEANPDKDVRTLLRGVPAGWTPRIDRPGTLKVYDLEKSVDQQGLPREEKENTWCAAGTFHSRLRLINATEEELSLLILALGILAPDPSLRLGGRKYHGFGAVKVTLDKVIRSFPTRQVVEGLEVVQWASERLQRALEDSQRTLAWSRLHEIWGQGGKS
jgi:hypothetical protein